MSQCLHPLVPMRADALVSISTNPFQKALQDLRLWNYVLVSAPANPVKGPFFPFEYLASLLIDPPATKCIYFLASIFADPLDGPCFRASILAFLFVGPLRKIFQGTFITKSKFLEAVENPCFGFYIFVFIPLLFLTVLYIVNIWRTILQRPYV